MVTASRAVFLSYASEDAEAAERIATALRGAGIEVWFDREELRGGDAWDRRIREQIHDSRLFIPVISARTEARDEGYFRREWRLAVDRAGDMAEKKAFLVPVVVDGTSERGASVPEKFRELQWTRLPAGETPPAFVQRVRLLVSPEQTTEPAAARAPVSSVSSATPLIREPVRPFWRTKAVPRAILAVVVVALGYLALDRFVLSKRPASAPAAQTSAPSTAAFAPPPHSIAVLPFVNMSGDKEQEYFSDGLTEEILNSLARISELQVSARTSSFSFKGKDVDLNTIAHRLNVASVLEGSVRRAQNTVRITAQLNNAVTGYHLWSETYDRDLSNVLQLQTEIANAVANALKVTLLGDIAAKIQVGGTRNARAFDAYLRGSKYSNTLPDANGYQAAIAAFTEAIGLDSNYALAFASRSMMLNFYTGEFATGPAILEGYDKALVDARHALALAPELPEGELALALSFTYGSLDFKQADDAYKRAMRLAAGDARILRNYGSFAVWMGQADAGLAAVRHAVALDPVSAVSHFYLGWALFYARLYRESLTAFSDTLALDPKSSDTYSYRGLAYYALGDFNNARSSCEGKIGWVSEWCLAITYEKLGRHADAEAELAKIRAATGDASAYQYATIYAQWGDRGKALEWLETAMRLRDTGLSSLKTDPLMDPLRNEPRFQAIQRELKFPS